MAKNEEIRIQSIAFQNLWNNRPDLRRRLFTINNNSENDIKGALNKAMGVLPGVSDQCFICGSGLCVWIEWKTETGTQSKDQIEWEAIVTGLGHNYVIVRSEEQFLRVINFYE